MSNDEVEKVTYIGIGEIALGHNGDILRISSLGSCIGLLIYSKNPVNGNVAVIGHIMLPTSSKTETKRENKWGPAKYADEAVPLMIKKLERASVKKENMSAKIVGGANMFGHGSQTLKIGKNNEIEVRRLLSEEKIELVRSYTGGDTGMSVTYIVKNNTMTIRLTGGEIVKL